MQVRSILVSLSFTLATTASACTAASSQNAIELNADASQRVYTVDNLEGVRLALPGQPEIQSINQILLDPISKNLEIVGASADEETVKIPVERVRLRKLDNFGLVMIEVTTLSGEVFEARGAAGLTAVASSR